MRRSGFTLIELVFVIIILGILAAVAIPRLAGVQDDATIASEQAGIGSARTGIQGLRSKIMLASASGQANAVTTITQGTGATATLTIPVAGATTSGNPNFLNTTATYLALAPDAATGSLTDQALAAVIEPGNRAAWTTAAVAVAGNNVAGTSIKGPASNANTGVSDRTASIESRDSWTYNPNSGTIAFVNVP